MTPRFHDSFSILLVFKFSSFLFLGNLISRKTRKYKRNENENAFFSQSTFIQSKMEKKILNETSVESSFEENIIFSS